MAPTQTGGIRLAKTLGIEDFFDKDPNRDEFLFMKALSFFYQLEKINPEQYSEFMAKPEITVVDINCELMSYGPILGKYLSNLGKKVRMIGVDDGHTGPNQSDIANFIRGYEDMAIPNVSFEHLPVDCISFGYQAQLYDADKPDLITCINPHPVRMNKLIWEMSGRYIKPRLNRISKWSEDMRQDALLFSTVEGGLNNPGNPSLLIDFRRAGYSVKVIDNPEADEHERYKTIFLGALKD